MPSLLFAQGKATPIYFGNAIAVDSTLVLIPVRYENEMSYDNKAAFWQDLYANIIIYNPKNDTHKYVFEKNTFISFSRQGYSRYGEKILPPSEVTPNGILYLVKNEDADKNGRIDVNDPYILYVSDRQGNNLRALTDKSENVEQMIMTEKQNFAMLKIQRDTNKDGNFRASDNDFYYVKLDLKTFTFGKKIEIKQ
jgi:hypothetical protein